MTKIKICGITNEQDALWAVNLGADFIGLNFYAQSPRKVSPKNAKDIVGKLPPFVVPVGVFVDADAKSILKLVSSTPLKFAQLHGNESPDVCREIKAAGAGVIKVISLSAALNPADWSAYAEFVDYFLIDNGTGDTPGGTGQTFDWAWLETAPQLGKPWFLAGGLNPDNVAEGIKKSHPFAVDVCSGIERLPTRKDFEAMKKFIQNVRGVK